MLAKILNLSTIFVLILVLFSCNNTLDEVKEIVEEKELPVKETFNVTYLRSLKGNLTNRITTPYVMQFKSGNLEFPNGFILEILDTSFKVTAHIEANYGKLNNESKTMYARDSVIFINIKNEALYTEELTWQQDSSRVFTDKFVKIKKKDVIILGKGLESNEDFSKYQVKNISGEYFIDEEKL